MVKFRTTNFRPLAAFIIGVLQAYAMASWYAVNLDPNTWSPDTRFFSVCAAFVLGNGAAVFVWAYGRKE